MADFNAGSIEGTLTLDRTPFTDGLRLAREQADQFEQDTITAHIDVDTGEAYVQLGELREDLDVLDGRNINIDVDVDDLRAHEQLDEIEARVDELDGRDIDIDTHEGSAALDQLGNSSIFAGRHMGLLIGSIAAVSPVIDPLIGEILGLVSALSVAAAGIGTFAVSVLPGISAVRTALSAQKSAQDSVGGSAINMAQQQKAAAEQVVQAEQSVANAQRASLQAQQALADAREAATRALVDSANAVKDAGLTLQQDQLNVINAQANYDAVSKSLVATDAQKKQAALDLAKAQQALVEQQITLQRSTEDNNDAQAAGVEGSQQVVNAQNNITQTSQQLQRAQFQLAQAQEAVANSQRSIGGGSNALASALAKLTPMERELYNQVLSLKGAFEAWGKSLEPATFPALIHGLQIVQDLLPKLTPLATATGNALSGVADQLGAAFNGPGFKTFLSFLTGNIGGVLSSLTDSTIHFGSGFAAMIENSKPLLDAFLGSVNELAKGFDHLGHSAAFKDFVAFIARTMPTLDKFFGDLFTLLGHILVGLEPAIGPVLNFLDTLVQALDTVIQNGSLAAIAKLFGDLLTALSPLLPVFAQLIEAALPPLIDLLDQLVKAGIAPLIAAFVEQLLPYLPGIAQNFADIATNLAPVIPLLVQDLAPALPGLAISIPVIAQALDDLSQAVKVMAPYLIPLVEGWLLWNAAIAVWDVLLDANPVGLVIIAIAALTILIVELVDHWGSVVHALKVAWDAFAGFFVNLWHTITHFIGRVLHGGEELVKNFWHGIKSRWDAFIKDLSGIFSGIGHSISSWIGGLYNEGWNLIIGLWNGIVAAWNGMVQWLNKAAGDVVHTITHIWEIFSPSRLMHRHGNNFIQGLFNGMRETWGEMDNWIKQAAEDFSPELEGSFTLGTSVTQSAAPVVPRPPRPGSDDGESGGRSAYLYLDRAGTQLLAKVVKSTNDEAAARAQ